MCSGALYIIHQGIKHWQDSTFIHLGPLYILSLCSTTPDIRHKILWKRKTQLVKYFEIITKSLKLFVFLFHFISELGHLPFGGHSFGYSDSPLILSMRHANRELKGKFRDWFAFLISSPSKLKRDGTHQAAGNLICGQN